MSGPRIVHVFPAFSTGGPEVRTAVLLNAMPEFAHTIVSLNGDVSGRCRLEASASVDFAPPPSRGGLAGLRSMGRDLGRHRPNLLVTYGWGGTDAILGARLAGLSAALHVEDGFLPDEARAQKPLRLQVRRIAFRLVAALVVPSRTLERLAAASWWLPSHRVRYIPNGVDTDRFTPATADQSRQERLRLHVAPDELVIGTVGMLRPDKNHARLLRLFADLSRRRPARLVVVGEGPCRPELEKLALELGIADRVCFAGAQVDPSWCYRAFDVFALSSDTEQMPLSVLEAMASGLPVVSTDVGDVAVMIAPQSGGAVSPRGDDDRLLEQLERFASDDVMRRAAGERNRARALAEFSLGRMIESYRQLFCRFLAAETREG